MVGSWAASALLTAAALWCGACGNSVENVGTIESEQSSEPYDATVLCGAHEPVEELSCEVAIGKGTCTFECVDGAGQLFDAECTGSSCRCMFNGGLECSCIFNEPSATCGVVNASCCPDPWP